MNELFGVSMNLIMYVLLAVLGLGLLSVAYVALRNRIMFKMGLRNIPRRRAQTTLIVVGLMLSTVIISAAFTTGDTVDRSITSQVYSVLGSLDEVVQLRAEDENAFEAPDQTLLREQTFAAAAAAPLVASLKASANLDFAIPTFSSVAVAINAEKRLSAPDFNIVGLDPATASGLPDIESLRGERLALAALAPGELYLNQSAADELDLAAGDAVQVLAGEKATTFRVKEVVRDRRLAGAGGISVRRDGAVMSLAAAQELFGARGELTSIAVSNRGGAREGYKLSAAAEADIRAAIAAARSADPALPELSVNPIKQTGVDIAEFGANLLTTFFLVFGLFSIGSGILLIFLIFLMLAAERKSEMGMARAVGTKRMDLVQTFLAEGMAYNLLAAAVGSGLGVLLAFGMSRVMASLFAQIDISISPYVTPRSLIISYSLGVALTFLTVTFSSWRVSNLNIVRAIRDIPEPPPQRPLWRAHGFLATLGRLFFKPGWVVGKRKLAFLPVWVPNYRRLGLLLLGLVLQGLAAGVGAAWLQVLFGTLAVLSLLAFVFTSFQLGPMFILTSLPLILFGVSEANAFLLMFGLSLLPLGLAFTFRSFGAPERLTYTLVGLWLIYIWEFDYSVGLIDKAFGETSGEIEMFFLSGVMVTLAATFLVVYNAEIVLGPLTRAGRWLGALLPSLKMAVAYPLANKTRTGMTMAMFCLVIFALTVMSSLNHNFNRIYLTDAVLGGFDIQVHENPSTPLGDLRARLSAAGAPVLNQIDAISVASVATRFRGLVCEDGFGRNCDPTTATALRSDFGEYSVWGEDSAFLNTSEIRLQSRARGYSSDAAVWQALAREPGLAVIDVFALGGGFDGGVIRGIKPDAETFEPVTVTLADHQTGAAAQLRIVGVIDQGASPTFSALHVSQASFDSVFRQADGRRYFLTTVAGADNKAAARAIEAALLETGAQAESLRAVLEEQTTVQSGFFFLLQGFMGLGLFVGVAAVGVIAFRTVVERRQQIGMLRAIGYSRGMVGLTFLMESAFIAFAGVVSGIVFALILARQLISEEFANQGVAFSVPWVQVGVIALLAFGSALLMTLIPSRQASSIPIAEALRYE